VNDVTPPSVKLLTPAPKRPAGLQLAVADAGAGVDPRSLTATIDGKSVDVSFARGRATIRLGVVAPGRHRLVFSASDYQELKNMENVPRILPTRPPFDRVPRPLILLVAVVLLIVGAARGRAGRCRKLVALSRRSRSCAFYGHESASASAAAGVFRRRATPQPPDDHSREQGDEGQLTIQTLDDHGGTRPSRLGGAAGTVLCRGARRLERPPEILPGDLEVVTRAPRLNLDDPHLGVVHAVAAGIRLRFRQRTQPLLAHHAAILTPWG
jgi:hypothetical protein